MKIVDLFENDNDHQDALDRTGFWGRAGAGCIILAKTTGRILLAHRSEDVEQPHTWGSWGGAIDAGEDPATAVRREVSEETGYHEPVEVIPLFIFSSGTFRYYNFLVVIEHEFEPELNWETQGYEWCEWGKWPTPLHFGLISLFKDAASVQKIKKEIMDAAAERQPTEESVGGVTSVAPAPTSRMMTAMQTAYQEGMQWGKENPRAMPKEVELACPYQLEHMSLRDTWIKAAQKAQNQPLQFPRRGITV